MRHFLWLILAATMGYFPSSWGQISTGTQQALQAYQQAVSALALTLSSESAVLDFEDRLSPTLKQVTQTWGQITSAMRTELQQQLSSQPYPVQGRRSRVMYDLSSKQLSRLSSYDLQAMIRVGALLSHIPSAIQPWTPDTSPPITLLSRLHQKDRSQYLEKISHLRKDIATIQRNLLAFMDILNTEFISQTGLTGDPTLYEKWAQQSDGGTPFTPAPFPPTPTPSTSTPDIPAPEHEAFGVQAALDRKTSTTTLSASVPRSTSQTPQTQSSQSNTSSQETAKASSPSAPTTTMATTDNAEVATPPLEFGEILTDPKALKETCSVSINIHVVIFLKIGSDYEPYTCTAERTPRKLPPEELRKHGLMGPKEITNYLTYVTYRSHAIRKYFEYTNSHAFAHYSTKNYEEWVEKVMGNLNILKMAELEELYKNTSFCLDSLPEKEFQKLKGAGIDVEKTECIQYTPTTSTTLQIGKYKIDISRLLTDNTRELRQFFASHFKPPSLPTLNVPYISHPQYRIFHDTTLSNFWTWGLTFQDQWVSHLLYAQYSQYGTPHACTQVSEEHRQGLGCDQMFEDRLPPYPFFIARGFFPILTYPKKEKSLAIDSPTFLPFIFKTPSRFSTPLFQPSFISGPFLITPVIAEPDVKSPYPLKNLITTFNIDTPYPPIPKKLATGYIPHFTSPWEMLAVFQKMKQHKSFLAFSHSDQGKVEDFRKLIRTLVPVVLPKSHTWANLKLTGLKLFHRPTVNEESAYVIDFDTLFLDPNQPVEYLQNIASHDIVNVSLKTLKVAIFGVSFAFPPATLGLYAASTTASMEESDTLLRVQEWLNEIWSGLAGLDRLSVFYKPINFSRPISSAQLPNRFVQDMLPLLSAHKISKSEHQQYESLLHNYSEQQLKDKQKRSESLPGPFVLSNYAFLNSELKESFTEPIQSDGPHPFNSFKTVPTISTALTEPNSPTLNANEFETFDQEMKEELSISKSGPHQSFTHQLGSFDAKIIKFIIDDYWRRSQGPSSPQITQDSKVTSQEILQDFGNLFQSNDTQTLIEFFMIDPSTNRNKSLDLAYATLRNSATNKDAFHDLERNFLIYAKITPLITQVTQGFAMQQPGALSGIKIPHVFHKAILKAYQSRYAPQTPLAQLTQRSFTFALRPHEVLYLNHANYGVTTALLFALSYSLNIHIFHTLSRLCMQESSWKSFMQSWTHEFRKSQNTLTQEAQPNKTAKTEPTSQTPKDLGSTLSNFTDKLKEHELAVYHNCHMMPFYPMEAFPGLRDFAAGDPFTAASTSLPTQDIENYSFRWFSSLTPLYVALAGVGLYISACGILPKKVTQKFCP